MKQVKLLFIITILIFSKVSHSQLSQHLTSTTYPEVIIENGTDYSTSPDNITVSPELTILELPGTNNSGMLPADMVYISAFDKLYIAGMSGIQVVNTNINSIENSMQFTCGRYTEWDASDWPNRRIGYQYNSTANRYEIFWLSETGNIFIYDASNCQRVQTLNIGDEYHKSRQISINPYTEELIAITNYALATLPYKAEFTAFSYNTTTQLYEKTTQSPTQLNRYIYDICFNYTRSRLYLTTSGGFVEIWDANPPYNIIKKISSNSNLSKLCYALNPSLNIHEIVATPFDFTISQNNGIIIDGDDDNVYQEISFPFCQCQKTIYHQEQNKYFFCNRPDENYPTNHSLSIFNASTHSLISSMPLGGEKEEFTSISINNYNQTNPSIYISSTDDLYIFDAATNTYTTTEYTGCSPQDIATNENTGECYCSLLRSGSVDIINQSGNIQNSIFTGFGAHKSLFNEAENTVYYYKTSEAKYNYIYAHNMSTDVITRIPTGEHLSDLILDKDNNQLLLSYYNSETYIYSIDCSTNNSPIPAYYSGSYTKSIYLSNSQKLYCLRVLGAQMQYLNILDINTNTILQSHTLWMEIKYLEMKCDEDHDNDIVYLSIYNTNDQYTGGRIYAVNDNNGQFIPLQPGMDYHSLSNDPDEIIFNKHSNELYVLHRLGNTNSMSFISVIDFNDPNPNTRIREIELAYSIYNLSDISFAENKNKMLVSSYSTGAFSGYVYIINCEDDSHTKLSSKGIITGMQYCPDNSTVYYLDINQPPHNRMVIHAYDFNNEFEYSVNINLHEKIISSPLVSLPQLAYNSNTNTICIPAGDRSKIFLMDANFERKRIKPGIQWISFPRLDRSANNAVDATDLLEMINIPPTYCEIEHQGIVSNADFQPPNWIWNQTNMDEIISSKGYKLTTTYIGSSPENVFIDIHGSRVSPTTYMSVTHQHENWLGYFLPYTCHVEDAFRKCWDDIKIIKTQKWSMVRLAPGTPFLSYPQDPYLYDGDMVVVEMFDNAYFQWDQPAIPILDVAVQEPQYFSWQEEPDYVPVVVELDPNDPADEVAVFVNNECQGAAVVTGTTNTINAYILDDSSIGDTMEIVTYTSSAKENKVKKHKGYFIFNPETGKSTKTVLTKNNWSYYYLPLKNTTADIDKYSFNRLSIYPNPTTNKITWRLFLSEPDHIVYHIFDSKGQEILKVDQGYHQAGNHSSTVDLKAYNLRPGVYFFHVAGNKINLVKKIVVR